MAIASKVLPRSGAAAPARVAACVLLAAVGEFAGAAPGDNEVVSISLYSARAAGSAFGKVSLSRDGRYVAFASEATTLVAGDDNGWSDVFVRDRFTGITERISVGLGGTEPNGGSGEPSVSADGRFVTFDSWASNLVAEDTNGNSDVFLHDRTTGITRRVSVTPEGGDFITWAGRSDVSDDGRFVVFKHVGQIYLRDVQAETTKLVADLGGSTRPCPAISGNGRYVAFGSHVTSMVYLFDRLTGSTQHIGGVFQLDGPTWCIDPSITGDGRRVAYSSNASEVPGDVNGFNDIYLLDRATGGKRLVSVDPAGRQGDGHSISPSVSDDGRFVAFRSYASNLAGGDTDAEEDLFVKDMLTGRVELVTDDVTALSLSNDGRFLGFNTVRALVSTDLNATRDTYVHEIGASSTFPDVYNYYLRPLRLEFGEVRLSIGLTKGFMLVNQGSTRLPITAIEVLGPGRTQYAARSYCGTSLEVGSRCWIAVTFKPTATGYKVANLHVVAGGIDRHRALRGTGVP